MGPRSCTVLRGVGLCAAAVFLLDAVVLPVVAFVVRLFVRGEDDVRADAEEAAAEEDVDVRSDSEVAVRFRADAVMV